MALKQINLLEELNAVSKIHTLKRDDIDGIMIEFAQRILCSLHLERLSVWLLNPQKDQLISMGEYDIRKHEFTKDNILKRQDFPKYFESIHNNEILLAPNIISHPSTSELTIDYSIPNDIISLMDIPLRLEGELIGVMCFEKTGATEREFTEREQTFAMSIAIVFASNLEARQRRALQHQLNKELKEKEILIKEIHHRVKNNLAVVSSLMNLQSHKTADAYHKALFDECRNKISAISGIHEIVYKSEAFAKLSVEEYLTTILNNLRSFYDVNYKDIQIVANIDPIEIPLDKAMPLALIINELVTNAYKHAFKESDKGSIQISVRKKDQQIVLLVSDDGKGFDSNRNPENSLGLEIVRGLVEQLNGESTLVSSVGTRFTLSFTVED